MRAVMGLFSVALLLRASKTSTAKFAIEVSSTSHALMPTKMNNPALENFRLSNPAARCLPLLVSLASGEPQRVVLENVNASSLDLKVRPL